MIQAKQIYHDAHEAYASRLLTSINLFQGAPERALRCTLMLKCIIESVRVRQLIEPDELPSLPL